VSRHETEKWLIERAGGEHPAQAWWQYEVVVTPRRPPPFPYRTVTPRIFVDDVGKVVAFLRAVFDATGNVEPERPTDVHIGDSVVIVSSASERTAFPAFLYVYVDDADATYRRAIENGAKGLEEPFDTPYGDRRAMFRDQFDNVYQVAHRL
jgi:PhnB protein